MKIVIIDYGAGNVQSVKFAMQRLGFHAILSNNQQEILDADKIIFPGVGEASNAMQMLKISGLDELIPKLKQPVLGICLGMQLMCNSSEEGNTTGLGIFEVAVKKFPSGEKIPQMGWNQISNLKGALFHSINEGEFMYLVHSYYVPKNKYEIATTNYGLNYATALQKDNFYGVQFHPEKSSSAGEKVLKNFLNLNTKI